MGSNGCLWGGITKIARMAKFRKLLRNIRSAFGQKKRVIWSFFWGAAELEYLSYSILNIHDHSHDKIRDNKI